MPSVRNSQATVAQGQQAVEGIRGEQHEGEEADAEQAHHAEHARHHLVWQAAAEQGHRHAPAGEHQRPQQQRAFVAAPGRGDAVMQRQRGIGVGGDVEDGEIVDDERIGQQRERQRHAQELAARRGTRQRDPGGVAGGGAEQRQRALGECQAEGEGERDLPEFRDHQRLPVGGAGATRVLAPGGFRACALATASAASGGM
jgi:hypothetical protein